MNNSIKLAPTDYPVHELILRRWSPRAYAPDPVEDDKLRQILEAARWAASSGNGQPWSFIIATQAMPDAFQRMVDCLKPGNAPWASKAPVLGIVVTKMVRANGNPNRHAFYDAGMAMQNLLLQAVELDLYARQMGGFEPETARALFEIPDDHEAVAMFALGYLGDPQQLADNHREQELAARARRPLQEFVYSEKWGDPSPVVAD